MAIDNSAPRIPFSDMEADLASLAREVQILRNDVQTSVPNNHIAIDTLHLTSLSHGIQALRTDVHKILTKQTQMLTTQQNMLSYLSILDTRIKTMQDTYIQLIQDLDMQERQSHINVLESQVVLLRALGDRFAINDPERLAEVNANIEALKRDIAVKKNELETRASDLATAEAS